MNATITGWAWRTPLGRDVDAVVRRWLAGERAAVDNPRFDARTYACTQAAPILDEPAKSQHSRVLRRMYRASDFRACERASSK